MQRVDISFQTFSPPLETIRFCTFGAKAPQTDRLCAKRCSGKLFVRRVSRFTSEVTFLRPQQHFSCVGVEKHSVGRGKNPLT